MQTKNTFNTAFKAENVDVHLYKKIFRMTL